MRRLFRPLPALFLAVPVAAQSPLPLDIARLEPRADSVVIQMNGQQMGWQRFTTERTADGFILTEETVTPGGGQRTRVELNRDGSVRSVQQQGTGRGAGIFTDISYSAGRVTGRHANRTSATAPLDTTALDAAVPAGVIDDNTLQSLMPALPWTVNASWTFPYYSSGRNQLSDRTLHVTGTESVTTPAGTFDTYLAEMDVGDNVIRFNVSRSAPHRVVRIRVSQMPIEFVLAK